MKTNKYNKIFAEQVESKQLSHQSVSNINLWLYHSDFQRFVPDIELLIAKRNWVELEDSFRTRLRIGTGGIRGPLGVGPNRINLRTIGEAAQGLSNFINTSFSKNKASGIIVGYETRKYCREFAELSCRIFTANEIPAFLFDSPRATPEISFAVRHLGATAGVQITASHNPKTDNGFKFYWSNGGQVVPPMDKKFMDSISNVDEIKIKPLSNPSTEHLISMIGKKVDESYVGNITDLSTTNSNSAKITFSPMHGVGSTNVLPVLKARGFNITIVPSQANMDHNFPTSINGILNPEYPEVMTESIKMGEKSDSDIVICSDPDGDRIRVATKNKLSSNEMVLLNGNQIGACLTHYLLSNRQKTCGLKGTEKIICTSVTTTLISDIAFSFGLKPINDLPVGFKFIANEIEKLPDTSKFIFGAEESLGYLAGDFVRDKDAAIASLLICELSSTLKDNDQTLLTYLNNIYQEFGYYNNSLFITELGGTTGQQIIKEVMSDLHENPPTNIDKIPILRVQDRLLKKEKTPDSYQVGHYSDMISMYLSKDLKTRISIRPSGTEPILKIYIQCHDTVKNDLCSTKIAVDNKTRLLQSSIVNYIGSRLSQQSRKEWNQSRHQILS